MENNKQQLSYSQNKCQIWDFQADTFFDITIDIVYTQTKEVFYIRDGSILRIEQIDDSSQKSDILTNLEQILNLQNKGKYGGDLKKFGKWITTWKGETLFNIGGLYSQDGKKQGLWKLIFNNYWSKAQLYEQGEYKEDLKIGIWKYIYGEHEIGGGSYNQQGYKIGRWIELSNNFFDNNRVTEIGEYSNGQRVGRWNIYHENNDKQEKIGGGSFSLTEESGVSVKFGDWIEQCDKFWNNSKATYKGKYDQNGQKVGRWDIYYRKSENIELIGGGSF